MTVKVVKEALDLLAHASGNVGLVTAVPLPMLMLA